MWLLAWTWAARTEYTVLTGVAQHHSHWLKRKCRSNWNKQMIQQQPCGDDSREFISQLACRESDLHFAESEKPHLEKLLTSVCRWQTVEPWDRVVKKQMLFELQFTYNPSIINLRANPENGCICNGLIIISHLMSSLFLCSCFMLITAQLAWSTECVFCISNRNQSLFVLVCRFRFAHYDIWIVQKSFGQSFCCKRGSHQLTKGTGSCCFATHKFK